MTIDDFWKKYNHCPKCIWYVDQGIKCRNCKWRLWKKEDTGLDLFEPTDEAIQAMNREVDA